MRLSAVLCTALCVALAADSVPLALGSDAREIFVIQTAPNSAYVWRVDPSTGDRVRFSPRFIPAPYGITCTPRGLFVAQGTYEIYNQILAIGSTDGSDLRVVNGNDSNGPIAGNYGIAATDDAAYLASYTKHSVFRVDLASGLVTVAAQGGQLGAPYDVAVTPSGALLVVDNASNGAQALIQIDPATGEQTLVAAFRDTLAVRCVAVSPSGSIYVMEHLHYDQLGYHIPRIARFDPITHAKAVVFQGDPLTDAFDMVAVSESELLLADSYGLLQLNLSTGVGTILSPGSCYGVAATTAVPVVVDKRTWGSVKRRYRTSGRP